MRKVNKRNAYHWSRLDNAALIYPSLATRDATRVFRLYCQFRQNVDPEALQRASDRALERYPEFAHTIRSGFFWHYREHTGLKPVVHEENQTPCYPLYSSNVHGLLIDISYYRCRLNFEIFHGLADGLGAAVFFHSLVLLYLEEAGLTERAVETMAAPAPLSAREDDAFRRYMADAKGEKTAPLLGSSRGRVYHFTGHRLPDRRQLVTEICVSTRRIRTAAKECGATVTAFLSALLLLSIRETMPANQRTRKICLSVPVNLRGHFASDTLRNFFSIVEIWYDPVTSGGDLERIVGEVRQALEQELTEENLGGKINQQVKIGKSVTIRVVPLIIKEPVIQAAKRLSERNSTMVFSNVGRMTFPEEAAAQVVQCGVYLSSATRQLVAATFDDRMVLSFAGTLVEKDVERAFLRRLAQYDDAIQVTANYGEGVWNACEV